MRSRLMRRRKFSEIQTNIELNEYGWFSVVIPEGRENLIKNPSFETNANGAVAVGGTIARTDDFQSHGAISLAVTPAAGVNDGMYYDDPAHDFDVAENTLYWPSFDFKADGGRKYKAYVARQYSGTQLGAAYPFTATGHRQRIEFPYREGDNTLVDNLIAYWKLTEATAATRMDSVGNNDLTPTGGANPGPSQITGKVGNAARFTRANTEGLTLADNTDMGTGDVDFLFAGWVRLTTKPAGIMALFSKWGAAGSREYALQWNNTTDRFVFTITGDGTTSVSVSADNFGAPATATWYFIEVWHDSVNNQIGIRVNRGTANTTAHATGVFDTGSSFLMGNLLAAQYLDGDLDEWGFWKGRLLSSTELDAIYNGGFADTYPFLYRRLYIVKDNETNTRPFYIDGLQFEAGDFPTTLIVGDMVGLVPNFDDYYWTGAPHESTSVRVANSADGGRVVNLRQLGLRVISHVGLGMTGLSLALTPLGNGGAFYQGTTVRDRSFNIIGEINGDEYQTLDMYEQALVDAFSPNRVSPQQPIKLLYQPLDDCGNSIGETLEIACLPDGDFLQMQTDNLNARRLALPFRLYLPFVAKNATDQGLIMQYQTAVQMSGMVRRMSDGTWDNLNGPTPAVAGNISVMKWGPDGRLYAGGAYTTIGGVAINGIGYYDPNDDAWHAMGTGQTTGDVLAIAFGPDGKVYVGGSYTAMGGVANTSRIAYWDGSAWNAMGTGAANNNVRSIAAGLNGIIYATGDFTGMGGIANTNFIAQWSGTAWSAMGTGLVGGVTGRTISVGLNGYIFVGGNYASASAVANTLNIAYWNPTAASWNSLGTGGANNDIYSSAVAPSGEVFFGGTYTVIGGQSINRISRYNGVSFFAMGTGAPAGIVQTLAYNQFDNLLYISGTFTSLSGLSPAGSVMAWNGSSFVWTDFYLPSPATITSFAIGLDQSIAACFNAFGILTPGYVQTVTNNGSDVSWPTVVLRGGSARVFQLVNRTTGAAIYFNLTLNNGEVATLILSPSGATFNSTFNGNILGTILPGSNTAGFNLQPGDNQIELFMTYTDVETGDGGAQLTSYSLQGVNTANSDSGTLYPSIVNLGGANRRVDFYQDSARTQLVAQTGTYAATGTQDVTEANSSGITGTVSVVAIGAADVDIVIVVPISRMYWSPDYASLSGAVRPRVL